MMEEWFTLAEREGDLSHDVRHAVIVLAVIALAIILAVWLFIRVAT